MSYFSLFQSIKIDWIVPPLLLNQLKSFHFQQATINWAQKDLRSGLAVPTTTFLLIFFTRTLVKYSRIKWFRHYTGGSIIIYGLIVLCSHPLNAKIGRDACSVLERAAKLSMWVMCIGKPLRMMVSCLELAVYNRTVTNCNGHWELVQWYFIHFMLLM